MFVYFRDAVRDSSFSSSGSDVCSALSLRTLPFICNSVLDLKWRTTKLYRRSGPELKACQSAAFWLEQQRFAELLTSAERREGKVVHEPELKTRHLQRHSALLTSGDQLDHEIQIK
ncbi:hypothetical protein ILYODFUR_022903 [Ilyodon furcidens]|uniref:Uncharacterized protein n=1 Tax=Ilyodon furcidens TaxID=33524 RepID=A0ABV0VGA8_9TELE